MEKIVFLVIFLISISKISLAEICLVSLRTEVISSVHNRTQSAQIENLISALSHQLENSFRLRKDELNELAAIANYIRYH